MDLKYFVPNKPQELRFKSKLIGTEVSYKGKRYIIVDDNFLIEEGNIREIGLVRVNGWIPFRTVLSIRDENINRLEVIY